jgi:hypothetical protein
MKRKIAVFALTAILLIAAAAPVLAQYAWDCGC